MDVIVDAVVPGAADAEIVILPADVDAEITILPVDAAEMTGQTATIAAAMQQALMQVMRLASEMASGPAIITM
ncbi:MAG: hypothetical protein LUH21_08210 [Clostridiales bacterium]|nr:hypothetical protein [Hungatella hathewayi]MCD7968664.1 hypothetical protein [Clostridiaceae bacterium]MCD7997200.1 hypothetical protein [Clostridiales bacterium]